MRARGVRRCRPGRILAGHRRQRLRGRATMPNSRPVARRRPVARGRRGRASEPVAATSAAPAGARGGGREEEGEGAGRRADPERVLATVRNR